MTSGKERESPWERRELKVVDTTFIISLLRNDPRTIETARELNEGGAATTVINLFEVTYGVYRGMSDIAGRLEASERVLSNLEVFPLDHRAAVKAAEIADTLDRKGKTIDPFDALIASIALVNGTDCLVTRNVTHFERIQGLRVQEH